jgi:CheY-like chemotaxis protein
LVNPTKKEQSQGPGNIQLVFADERITEQLLEALKDLEISMFDPEIFAYGYRQEDLPDSMIIDADGYSVYKQHVFELRKRFPSLKIFYVSSTDSEALRRIPAEGSSLIPWNGLDENDSIGSLPNQILRKIAPELLKRTYRHSPSILLAEDEENIRLLTTHFLLLQGYEVFQAVDGVDAVDLMDSLEFDMILSDVYMPRMNGFKLMLEIKNRYPDMPILMLTGYNSAAKILSTTRHKGVDFMSKPFRLNDLGVKVKTMLS